MLTNTWNCTLNKIADKLLKIVSKILVLQCLYKQKQDQEKLKN